MVKLFFLTFVLLVSPNKIDGFWNIYTTNNNNWIGVVFQESNSNALRAVVIVPVAGKAAYIPFVGDITRSNKTISIVLKSKSYKVSDTCKVDFVLIAVGLFKSSPLRFETKARIINFIDCDSKQSEIIIDDISGTWKFIKPLLTPKVDKKITI
ncbi:MAG: hypothetical protein WC516_05195 [Patescibacteria group bacterium]|jgi:hypothetical protein